MASGVIGLSTTTMALFISPPFIRLCSSNASSSCKKQKVRHGAISLLKSFMCLRSACCVPRTGELKSIKAVTRYSFAGTAVNSAFLSSSK